ncbi:unnamed protein product [Durusdinium trenchii]|uniref:Uncharacterized protein n=1 Tax=Durusdinium trenchii TaxID=1381693 RepID=A0ABP0QBY2_9DINO
MSAVPKRPVRVVPDFPRGNACLVQWFLDYAEALLSEVLCFLDGLSLTFLELCSTWWRRLVSTNLAGVWRFIHLCALGARPPMSLARPPKGVTRGGGPWKQLWLAHRWLLAEPDGRQRSVAFEQARLLLSPGSHAVVQPMKPSQRFLINIIKNCLDGSSQPDPRFGPLHKRWCSHLMVGAEAMVTHANGVQTNHEQLYMSWSVCFSAMQGLPRLFLASAREAQSAWEVDLAECRLPPKAPLPWAAAAQEIHELRAAGRPLRSGLCDAVELCSFRRLGVACAAGAACSVGVLAASSQGTLWAGAKPNARSIRRSLLAAALGTDVPQALCPGASKACAGTRGPAASLRVRSTSAQLEVDRTKVSGVMRLHSLRRRTPS